MALAGQAIVAIWNDITAEGRANFYEWHNREHMPERLGIDGFLRGRRYKILQEDFVGSPEYFTLYEVQDAGVLAGSAYLDRLNNPTEWTKTSVAHFRNVARSLCTNEISLGAGSGGFVATLRFDCDPAVDAELMDQISGAFTELAAAAGIVACQVSRADLAISTAKTAEQKGRPDNAVPRWVILVETSTPEAARSALAGSLGTETLAAFAPIDAAQGVYALQFDLLASQKLPKSGDHQ